jgi:hypothetical protein
MPSELISRVSETLRVGQVLSATTQRGGSAMSKVLIQLGEHTLQAKTPVRLETGQEIKLLVKAAGDAELGKLPLLTILPPKQAQASNAELSHTQLAQLKLRQFIAIQQAFSQPLQTAQSILDNKPGLNLLPAKLINQLNQLQSALQLSPEQLSGKQLKQQIENSGIFLESKLQNLGRGNSVNLNQDFKQLLLNIRQVLNSSGLGKPPPAEMETGPLSTEQRQQIQQLLQGSIRSYASLSERLIQMLPRSLLQPVVQLLSGQQPTSNISTDVRALAELISQTLQHKTGSSQQTQELMSLLNTRFMLLDLATQVERSLGQLSSFQLQPLSREADGLTLLLFNLLLKDKDQAHDIHFRIEQENAAQDPAQQGWKVSIYFNFNTLGKLQTDIHLMDNRVSSIFYCEQDTTSARVRSLLPVLQDNLDKAGFIISGMRVSTRASDESPVLPPQTHLLDENI